MTVNLNSTPGTYNYRVLIQVVTPSCTALTSNAVTVTVKADPLINTQPVGGTICEGSTFSPLSVSASVEAPFVLSYQWQESDDNGVSDPWGNVVGGSGAATSSYTTAALTADRWYRVNITSTGSDCNQIYSTHVKVSVNNLTAGTIELAQTICEGDIPAGLTSTALATGDGDITYRWQVSTNGTDFSNISPAQTGIDYSPGSLLVDTWYRRVAISTLFGVPCESNSNIIKITVNNLTAGTIATAQTICENTTADLTGTLPTADGTISYQWQSSSTQVGGYTNVSNGGTGQNYTTVALTADTWFQRIVTSTLTVAPQAAKACSKISDPILVTVNNFTSANTIGTAQTICATNTANLTGNAMTADGAVTYQWQSSLTEVGGYTNVSNGGTGQDYTTVALSADTWFQRVATSTQSVGGNPDKACTLTSSPVLVTVNNLTSGSIQLAQTICEGDTPALLTTLSAPTQDGSISYQWEISTESATTGFSDISPDGTNETYQQPLALTQDTWFRRRAISTLTGVECTATSVAIKITVNNFTSANTIAGTQTICNEGTAGLTGNAVTGDGDITYQWQSSSTEVGGYSNVSNGGTGQNYTSIALTANTWFRRIATSTLTVAPAAAKACTLESSAPVLVTVVPDPQIDTQPSSITICSGATTILTVFASEGTPSLDYQWQISTIPSPYSWSDVIDGSGGNTSAYTTANLTQTTYYRVTVSATGNGCNPVTSNVVTVSIPRITTQPVSAVLCEGGTHNLEVVIEGGDATLAYQWQFTDFDCNSGWSNISGATNSTYTTTILPTSGIRYFRCNITVTNPACATLTTNCVSVEVLSDPEITLQPTGTTICIDGTHTMTVAASGGTGTLTYQWQQWNGASWISAIGGSGSITTQYTTPALTASTDYRVTVSQSGTGCDPIISSTATVVVIPDPIITTQITGSVICEGGFHSMVVVASGGIGSYTYQWQSSADGLIWKAKF
jgi:hypothetical protein